MATQLNLLHPPAVRRPKISTRKSFSASKPVTAPRLSRFSRPPACVFRPSADLAGRPVSLSRDIPVNFDRPLAPHHKLVGRWIASRTVSAPEYSRPQARWHIERAFETAVLEILEPIDLVDLRVMVLQREEGGPPAIAVICDSLGQLDLGWIEDSDAPIPWRTVAYKLLERTLGSILPVFDYEDLFDHFSMYYWEGATDDEEALRCLIEYHGVTPDDLESYTLPSAMNARRPGWMIGENAGRSTCLPDGLRTRMAMLRNAHRAFLRLSSDEDAWHFDEESVGGYIPEFEDHSMVLPLTLVPLEQFRRDIDEMAQHGMEYGFMDVIGLCPLPGADRIDDWLASLRLGAQFLIAVQELLHFDPTNP